MINYDLSSEYPPSDVSWSARVSKHISEGWGLEGTQQILPCFTRLFTTQCRPLINLPLLLVVPHDLLLSSPVFLVNWDMPPIWTVMKLRCLHALIWPRLTTAMWSHSTRSSTLLGTRCAVVSCPFIDKNWQLLVKCQDQLGEGSSVRCRRSWALGWHPSQWCYCCSAPRVGLYPWPWFGVTGMDWGDIGATYTGGRPLFIQQVHWEFFESFWAICLQYNELYLKVRDWDANSYTSS